jgi:hypothetical protein
MSISLQRLQTKLHRPSFSSSQERVKNAERAAYSFTNALENGQDERIYTMDWTVGMLEVCGLLLMSKRQEHWLFE